MTLPGISLAPVRIDLAFARASFLPGEKSASIRRTKWTTYISFYEFRQIDVPNFEGYRECQHFRSTFVYLQTLSVREINRGCPKP